MLIRVDNAFVHIYMEIRRKKNPVNYQQRNMSNIFPLRTMFRQFVYIVLLMKKKLI